MTAIDFPNSPTVNQTFTLGSRVWKWTGTTWDVVVTTQIVGPTGPQGPQGPSGQSFTYTPQDARTIWIINHNLGFNPNITILDSVGNECYGQILYNDNNSLTLTFSEAVYGTAYLS